MTRAPPDRRDHPTEINQPKAFAITLNYHPAREGTREHHAKAESNSTPIEATAKKIEEPSFQGELPTWKGTIILH